MTLEEIKNFAINKHNQPSDCQRYGSAPYSKHLLDVVSVKKQYEYYLSDDVSLDVEEACYCHDLVEDTDVSADDIEQITNKRVASIVFKVTNERGENRKVRNFKTYPKIWDDDLAIFVKLCDRIANTRNSKSSGHSMFEKYKKEYALFKYALKVRNLYPDMWNELEELYYK
jgi:(p)ppGpp synthase/HD superfamily hydrolase